MLKDDIKASFESDLTGTIFVMLAVNEQVVLKSSSYSKKRKSVCYFMFINSFLSYNCTIYTYIYIYIYIYICIYIYIYIFILERHYKEILHKRMMLKKCIYEILKKPLH